MHIPGREKSIKAIKLKQDLAIAAIVIATFAFVLMGMAPLFPNALPATPVGWFAVGSLFCAVVALIAAATAKCPRCKKEFTGDTSDAGGPSPKPFASSCQYCGYPDDAA